MKIIKLICFSVILICLQLVAGTEAKAQTPNPAMPQTDGQTRDIFVSGVYTYVGGEFNSPAINLFRYNTETGAVDATWTPNPDNMVHDIKVVGENVYVAGDFSSIGGQSLNYLAKLNTTNGDADPAWNPNPDDGITKMTVDGNEMFVCSGYSMEAIGGLSRYRIAKIELATGAVTAFDANVDNDGHDVANATVDGSYVYITGSFSSIGGVTRYGIARLDKTTGALDLTWDANASTGARISGAVIDGGSMYVTGGTFDGIGGQARDFLAKLDVATGLADPAWSCDADGGVGCAVVVGNDLYVSGNFSTIGGEAIAYVAKIDKATGVVDNTWNIGADDVVRRVRHFNNNALYMVGDFTTPTSGIFVETSTLPPVPVSLWSVLTVFSLIIFTAFFRYRRKNLA